MAVESPPARIVCIECYDNACPRSHQHGITHRAREPLGGDLHHLELVPVEMPRERHRCLILEHPVDAVAICKGPPVDIFVPGDAVDRPDMAFHGSRQVDLMDT